MFCFFFSFYSHTCGKNEVILESEGALTIYLNPSFKQNLWDKATCLQRVPTKETQQIGGQDYLLIQGFTEFLLYTMHHVSTVPMLKKEKKKSQNKVGELGL